MENEQKELIWTRIILAVKPENGELERVIGYIYNRETFDELGVTSLESFSQSQLLRVGQKITWKGYSLVIKEVMFQLHPKMQDTSNFYGMDFNAPGGWSDYNSAVWVYV